MGKVRPQKKSKSSRSQDVLKLKNSSSQSPSSHSTTNPSALISRASELLQTGQLDLALPYAQRAVSLLSSSDHAIRSALPALNLLGQVQVEMGDVTSALKSFEAATKLDPDGVVPEEEGGGAEKFLWLAQLCEDGGKESLRWFERGIKVLQQEILHLESGKAHGDKIEERRRKVAAALCGMIEVWMTDLSLEPEAEAECESLISQAILLSPSPQPSTLQTLASIRLSQARLDDAQSALTRSLELWKDLPPEHVYVPDFAARISLARLLMEAEMEDVALEVVERLVGEDDQSVEAWYLGGWCLWLMGSVVEDEQASGENENENEVDAERKTMLMSSREWLRNCLKLYELLDYEDDRLGEHATELVRDLDKELGDAEIEDEDEEWADDDGDEDTESAEDHEMNGT